MKFHDTFYAITENIKNKKRQRFFFNLEGYTIRLKMELKINAIVS